MQKRKLGKSDLSIRPLGLGCAAIGGYYTRGGRVVSRGTVDDKETIQAIHAALAQNIQLFDVANIYGAGHAERILGQALSGGKREQAIIQTKFGASFDEVTRAQIDYEGLIEPLWIRNSLEGSLRRLQTDYIDIFQFQIADYALEGIPAIIDLLNNLVAEGKIRSYSMGTGNIEQARLFVEAPYCANIITNHNVLTDAQDMLTLLEQHQVALLAGLPFFMGLLTGKYNTESKFEENDIRSIIDLTQGRFHEVLSKLDAIKDILQSDGRTVAQGALAWLWARHPLIVPLPGFKTVEQVEENAKALEFAALSQTQMDEIASILN